MTGLESRLQAVEGVKSIELELGEEGLEGITVRLVEGADEVSVLEGIRRLLVAYGTKRPRVNSPGSFPIMSEDTALGAAAVRHVVPNGADRIPPQVSNGADLVEDEIEHHVVDLDEVSGMVAAPTTTLVSATPTHAAARSSDGSKIELSILAAGEETAAIELTRDDREVRRQVPASARAIVQAVIDCAGELVGRDPISVIGMNLSSIEGTRVLTVIAGNHGASPRVCTVSVLEDNWPAALLSVLFEVLGESISTE